MRHCYSAHGPNTLVMERTKSLEQILAKRPALTSVEKDAKSKRIVDLTFDFGLNIFPREDAFIHGPKYGRGRLDPFFDIGVRRERASDQRPKALKIRRYLKVEGACCW